jgi:hypothetical protein
VTINGNNFNSTSSANIVFFGSVQATVSAATTTSLTVTVPAGNSYQPLTVTTGGLTAFSAQPFITTFSDPGQFTPNAFTTRWDISTLGGPQSIFNIDMDGDGKSDLIVANGDADALTVYHNNSTTGTLSFSQAVNFAMPPGYYPVAVTAGDLDGDGKPEIILANYGSPQLAIFRNTSTSGTISLAAPVYYALGNYTTGVRVADCNGDGKPEIIVASVADNVVSLYLNNSTVGSLSFSPKMDLHLPSGTLPYDVVVSDLDGDGMPDLASVNAAANTVSVWRNTGTIGGALSFATNTDFSVGGSPQDLAVGDLDGDGKPDLAVVNSGDATITLLKNTCTSGSMSFVRGTDVPTGNLTSGSPWAIVMSDFDGDGMPDIAVINQLDNTVSIHRNTSTPGAPSIAANVDYSTGDVPWALTAADLDGDGEPDLAIIDNTTANITLLLNKNSSQPAIVSFSPTVGPAGTVVTITGANLGSATAVSFGGVAAASFTVNSSTSITATVANGATGVVSVTTPTGPVNSSILFNYQTTVPTAPSITSFTPTSGSPGTMITINGAHLTGTSMVTFGGVYAASFNVVSDNQITAVVGNGSSGNVVVKVLSASDTLPGFTYVSPPISMSSFSPQSGAQGALITIKGHGFLTAQSVTFGGVAAASFTRNGDTTILAYVGTGASGGVVVSGTNGTDSQLGFTFINNPPPPSNGITITSFTPTSGRAGDTVHIRGTNLTSANNVTFGGTQALFFQASNDSNLTATVGGGSTGAVRVANNTTADSIGTFTFIYDTTKLSSPKVFQLIQFSGSLSGSNDPNLQWQVVNDASISYYVVESSDDSLLFNVVGTVKSSRNNGSSHMYSYTDVDPVTGSRWYRLKMQDTTAGYTYSQKVRLQPVGQLVHPNPVKYGFFKLDPPDVNSASQVQVVEMGGRVLQDIKIAPGISEIRVNIPGLSTGTYRVTWTNGIRTASTTILVLPK